MILRCATSDDARILFIWRNDPITRLNSKNSAEISWESHLEWLSESLNMEARKIFLAEDQGELIGTVRSDLHPDGRIELSWTISPSHRGQGLGKKMVRQFVEQIHPKQKIFAIIQDGNISSEKIAQSLGLHPQNHIPSEIQLISPQFRTWC